MTRILAIRSAFPEGSYAQEAIVELLSRSWSKHGEAAAKLKQLAKRVGVERRHLALPLERYPALEGWEETNALWTQQALALGTRSLGALLETLPFALPEIGAFLSTTVTGIATPSLDAHLLNRYGLPSDLKRMPLFGLGCAAGASLLARASDYVRAYPEKVALVFAVELCSLTWQQRDLSTANLIASLLFGDGAATALVAGEAFVEAHLPALSASTPGRALRRAPQVVATRSVFYRETLQIMGWKVKDSGLEIVLAPELISLIESRLRDDMEGFLSSAGVERGEIAEWIIHPGGPKVLNAIQSALELDDEALAPSWTLLRERGNLSSVSVLTLLEEKMAGREAPRAGSYGLLFAMGPGFALEMLLLKW